MTFHFFWLWFVYMFHFSLKQQYTGGQKLFSNSEHTDGQNWKITCKNLVLKRQLREYWVKAYKGLSQLCGASRWTKLELSAVMLCYSTTPHSVLSSALCTTVADFVYFLSKKYYFWFKRLGWGGWIWETSNLNNSKSESQTFYLNSVYSLIWI